MTEQDKHDSEDTGTMPIVVIYDSKSKSVTADVVTSKGVNDYDVARVKEKLRAFGYSEVIFNSDQEPAILALKDAVAKEWQGKANMDPIIIRNAESPVRRA